jgi:hypothetical protein
MPSVQTLLLLLIEDRSRSNRRILFGKTRLSLEQFFKNSRFNLTSNPWLIVI